MPPESAKNKQKFFVTVDRIEEQRVVLELEKGKTFNLPLACLPDDIMEGERIRITCERELAETAIAAREAKNLLNDILHSS